MQHLEVSGAVVLYIGRTVSKGSLQCTVFPRVVVFTAQWTLRFNTHHLPARTRHFPLLQNVQTRSGAHAASYSVGTVLLFAGVSGGA
jgi:low affinity Fe/Cu permease